MNFFLACFAWLFLAALLGAGILVLAYKGSVWLLLVAIVVLVGSVWRIGCKTH